MINILIGIIGKLQRSVVSTLVTYSSLLKRKEKGHIKNVTGKTKKMGLTLVGMSSENKKNAHL